MNANRVGKEVGIHSGDSGHSGPIAQMRSQFGVSMPAPLTPRPVAADPIAAPPAAAPEPPAVVDRVPPDFPPDAVIVIADADGRYSDDRRFSGPHMWCWINGPTWFYVKDSPIPDLRKAMA
jgi:hypothetical protein